MSGTEKRCHVCGANKAVGYMEGCNQIIHAEDNGRLRERVRILDWLKALEMGTIEGWGLNAVDEIIQHIEGSSLIDDRDR